MTGRTQRSKRLRHAPPDVGVYGAVVMRLLQRNPQLAWPPSEIVRAVELPDRVVWYALQNLLRLGLIERRSTDSMIRVRLTAPGRRYVVARPHR